MRLGLYPIALDEGSRGLARVRAGPRSRSATATATRSTTTTSPRLEKNGLRISGIWPEKQLVEIVELPDHPWFVAGQFHPEFRSRPWQPHPLFAAFIRAALEPIRAARVTRRPARTVRIGARRRRRRRAAGPDRRALRDRERGARARWWPSASGGSTEAAGVPFVYKSSYDKANRSSLHSYRGPGLREGLRILRAGEGGGRAARAVRRARRRGGGARRPRCSTCLQVPAFLCRQTDLLLACGRTRQAGQREEGPVRGAARTWATSSRSCARRGNEGILLTERGASFGYNNLVVDFRGLADHAGLRLSGGLRRHPLGAASRRRRRPLRRRAPVRRRRSPAPRWRSGSTRSSWRCTRIPTALPDGRPLSDGPNMLRARRPAAAARRAPRRSAPGRTGADGVTRRRDGSSRSPGACCALEAEGILALARPARRALRPRGRAARSGAAGASSSPAWASPAWSAGRSPPRWRAPARRPYFLHPAEGVHGDLGMVARDDVVLALSNSGETDELLALLPRDQAARRAAGRSSPAPPGSTLGAPGGRGAGRRACARRRAR